MVRSIGDGLAARPCQCIDIALTLSERFQQFKANRMRQGFRDLREMRQQLELG